ncbi:hypothetical protein AB0J48_17165 [Nocardia salmonicida]|uniref:hypothetical protein n=1 Tax=Nocardia salmonicida TaxID=53431 RepID=UPI0034175EED
MTYHLPAEACALVSSATIDTYAPGAKCGRTERPRAPRDVTQKISSHWRTGSASTESPRIWVAVVLSDIAPGRYAATKDEEVDRFSTLYTVVTSTPVDLGEQGYLISGTSRIEAGLADAQITARLGNAVIDVYFQGYDSTAVSEAAAKAVVADIVNNLAR